MGRVHGKYPTQVLLAEDQHPVGDLGPHCQDEAFGETIRTRTPGGILTTSMPAPASILWVPNTVSHR